jgi:hypothetical protein
MTTKGDLVVHDGTANVRLPVGANDQVLTADSTQSTGVKWAASASGTTALSLAGGRLSLTSGTAVTTSDVTAATTLYYTPYLHDQIALYDGSAWSVKTFTERSLSLSSSSANTNYDIFLYDNAGTLTLEAVAWTNDTTRATALATQNGVYVKSGAATRRYLGTIRITGTAGQCEDSVAKRFVWNLYNRVPRHLYVTEATATWTYTTATWRQANGSTANQVALVRGLNVDLVTAQVHAMVYNTAATYGSSGIGVSSTTTNSAQTFGQGFDTIQYDSSRARYSGYPGLGYYYIAWLEISAAAGTTTWASANVNQFTSGLHVETLA